MNTRHTIWIDQTMHRATAVHCCDGTCWQGRDCPQIVPRVSMLAGKPEEFDDADRDFRALVWKVLSVLVLLFWVLLVRAFLQEAQ